MADEERKEYTIPATRVVGNKTYFAGKAFLTKDEAKQLGLTKGGKADGGAEPAGGAAGGDLPDDFPARELLTGAGFTTLDAVRSASDEALLEINGIGDKRLQEIREAQG